MHLARWRIIHDLMVSSAGCVLWLVVWLGPQCFQHGGHVGCSAGVDDLAVAVVQTAEFGAVGVVVDYGPVITGG